MPGVNVIKGVVWIDIHFHPDEERKGLQFQHDFAQWVLDNNVYPVGKGHSGPLEFSGAYMPNEATRLLVWLKEQGVKMKPEVRW